MFGGWRCKRKQSKVTWIASYLSFAANACGAAVNSGALCIGDWTALMANFGEMATVGAAVKEDCDFNKDWLALLKITGTDDAGLLKRSYDRHTHIILVHKCCTYTHTHI